MRHRKLRKKIASAKWYAKKMVDIRAIEDEYKRKLREQHNRRQQQRLWTPLQFAYNRCVTEHTQHGFPCRPASFPVFHWLRLIDLTYAAMGRIQDRHPEWAHRPGYVDRWNLLKKLTFQELRKEYQLRFNDIPCAVEDDSESPTVDSMWTRFRATSFPFTCSAVGWLFVGLLWRGVHTYMWPRICAHLHHRMPMDPNMHPFEMAGSLDACVWLDDDIDQLLTQLEEELPSPVYSNSVTSDTKNQEEELWQDSLDSILNDAFAIQRDQSTNSKPTTMETSPSTTNSLESFDSQDLS